LVAAQFANTVLPLLLGIGLLKIYYILSWRRPPKPSIEPDTRRLLRRHHRNCIGAYGYQVSGTSSMGVAGLSLCCTFAAVLFQPAPGPTPHHP
jgi:hypothetical protein